MEKAKCSLCNIEIKPQQDIIILSCKHTFHARCGFVKITRFYGYCPLCKPESIFGGLMLSEDDRKDEKHQVHPIDWGDDGRVGDLIEKRKILLDQISTIKHVSEVKVKDISDFFEEKEQRDEEEAENATSTDPNGKGGVKAWDVFKDLFTKSIVADMTSKVYIDIDRDPIQMIQERVPSNTMYSKYHIDIKSLQAKKISIDFLLRNGYTIVDLIVLQATWLDIKHMGLSPDTIQQFKKTSLPIKTMVDVWKISIHDIFVDVCNRDFNVMIGNINFTFKELQCLGAADINLLLDLGLTKNNIDLFKFDMETWKSLGMTIEHMKNPPLRLTDTFIRDNLDWIQHTNQETQFQELFGSPLSSLQVKTRKKKQ